MLDYACCNCGRSLSDCFLCYAPCALMRHYHLQQTVLSAGLLAGGGGAKVRSGLPCELLWLLWHAEIGQLGLGVWAQAGFQGFGSQDLRRRFEELRAETCWFRDGSTRMSCEDRCLCVCVRCLSRGVKLRTQLEFFLFRVVSSQGGARQDWPGRTYKS